MESAGVDGGLLAGQLNAAIANEIGKLTADFTGRGSEKSARSSPGKDDPGLRRSRAHRRDAP